MVIQKEHPLKIKLITYDGRPELSKIAQVLQSDAKKQILKSTLKVLMTLKVT